MLRNLEMPGTANWGPHMRRSCLRLLMPAFCLVCTGAFAAPSNVDLQTLYEQPTARILEHMSSIQGPRNVLFCVDVSGSMLGPVAGSPTVRRYAAASAAYRRIVERALRPGDYVTVIYFGQEPEVELTRVQLGSDRSQALQYAPSARSIISPQEQQGTNILYAHHLAADQALKTPGDSAAVVILFSDGYLDPPPAGSKAREQYELYLPNAAGDAQRLAALGRLSYYDYVGDEAGIMPAPPGQPVPPSRGRLTGAVVSAASQQPLPNVTVEAYVEQSASQGETEPQGNDQQPTGTAATDEAGQFEIAALSAGTYSIHASAEGYRPQSVSGIVINGGQTTQNDLSMELPPRWGLIALVLALVFVFAPWPFHRDGKRYLTIGPIPIPHQDRWAIRVLVVPWLWDRRRSTDTARRSSTVGKPPPS